jgi:hypothetical protein
MRYRGGQWFVSGTGVESNESLGLVLRSQLAAASASGSSF